MGTDNEVNAYDKTNLLIENAVLRSSSAFRKEVDETLEKQQAKTEQLIRDLHDDYSKQLSQVAASAANALSLAGKALRRTDNIWAKVVSLCAASTVIGGAIGFIVELTINKP